MKVPSGWLAPGLIFLLAILAFLPALRNQPVFDDITLVQRVEPPRTALRWLRAVAEPWWGFQARQQLWRPVPKLSIYLQRALHPGALWPCYAFNLLLHGGVSVLVLAVARRLSADACAARLAAAMFALHPLHAEAVHQIVGRAELFAAGFMLCGFWLLLRHGWGWRGQWLAQGACFALAIGSKESAITYPALVALLWWVGGERPVRPLLRVAISLAVVGSGFLFARQAITGGLLISRAETLWHENVLFALPFLGRLPAVLGIWAYGLSRLVWPFGLSPDYCAISFPLEAGWAWPWSWAGLLGAVAALGYALFALRRRRSGWALLLAGLISYAPASNFFFPIGVAVAERLWYWPSAFGCLGLGWGLARGLGRLPPSRLRGWIPCLLGAYLLGASWCYAPAWRNLGNLTQWTLTRFPQSIRGLLNAAQLDYDARQHSAGYAKARQALDLNPDFWLGWYWLGMHAAHLPGKAAEAETAYRRALQLEPGHTDIHRNLGLLYESQGRPVEALQAYERYLHARPGSDREQIESRARRLRGVTSSR